MRVPRPQLRIDLRLWLGVAGAPAAWATQHVTLFALSEAECSQGFHGQVALDGLTIAVTAVAATVAVLAELAAIATFRATRDAGEEPPGSRVHFMSVVGMTIGPLFLAIVLMNGFGVLFLDHCTQS